MTTNIILADCVLFLSEILRIVIIEDFSNLIEANILNHFIFVLFFIFLYHLF